MSSINKREDLSDKIKVALDKAIKKVIAETKAKNSYLVIADKDGKIKKILPKIYKYSDPRLSVSLLNFK